MGLADLLKAAVAAVALSSSGLVRAAAPSQVRVAVLSKVEETLGVYWINTWQKGALVRQREDAIPARGILNVDSYFGHSFLVVDEKYSKDFTHYVPAIWDPKIMTMFTMAEFDLEAIIKRDIDGNLTVKLESALTRTSDLMEAAAEQCRYAPEVKKAHLRRKGLAAVGSCPVEDEETEQMSPEFMTCMTKAIAGDLAKKETEATKSMRMLEKVGDRARNYTCADPLMETSNTSLKDFAWLDPEGGETIISKVFLDEPDAKIYLIDNFASDEVCQMLISKASPHLQDATVNGGGGKYTLSSARRAKAGAVVPDLNDKNSPVSQLYRRGYNFANQVTGYNMTLPGQEGFSVVKYGSTDEYRPHCDGDCTGMEYVPGGRVASIVVYCEQAEIGGGTTFSSSDVFINGKKGQAAFFSYLGPDGRTDVGRTRHSGCPIIKGTKWIATMWMRLGVTAERSWHYYDPSGMPSEKAQQEKKRLEEGGDAAELKEAVETGESAGEAAVASAVASNKKAGGETGTVTASGGDLNESHECGEGCAAEVAAAKEDVGILGSISGSLSSVWGSSKS